MSETTLRLKSIADVAALNEWTRAIMHARNALQMFTEAQRASQTATSGGAGAAPGAPGGAATPHSATAAPAPAVAAQAATQAPAAPPPPPVYQPGAAQVPAAPGANYAPPPAPREPGVRAFTGPSQDSANWGAGVGGTMARGVGYIGAMGAAATGFGLGSSILGFLMASGQTFMQISKTVAALDARFRDLGSSAAQWGGQMGYTIAQTAGLVEAYGAQTGAVDQEGFQRNVGFSRTYGLDPGATLGILGGMQNLSRMGGASFDDRALANIAGHAQSQQMGQGRFSEYLQQVQGNVSAAFEGSGTFDLNRTLAVNDFAGQVFGAGDPRGQGQSGQALLQGINQGMGSSGGKMLLMRAMGYGAKGSTMSYEDMRIRQDMGVNDPENVRDLLAYFDEHGLDRNKKIRAFEEMGTGLPMWRIRALVDGTGDKKHAGEELVARAEGDAEETYIKRAGIADYKAAGIDTVSTGEGYEVKMEGEKVAAGQYVAQGMVDMNDAIINMAKGIQDLLGGVNLGEVFTDTTGAIKDLTEAFREFAGPFRETADAMLAVLTPGEAAGSVARTVGQALDPLRPIYVITELTRYYESDAGSAP